MGKRVDAFRCKQDGTADPNGKLIAISKAGKVVVMLDDAQLDQLHLAIVGIRAARRRTPIKSTDVRTVSGGGVETSRRRH